MLILDGVDLSASRTWYHVRLPILPNNSTGWVPAERARDALHRPHAPVRQPRDGDGDAQEGRRARSSRRASASAAPTGRLRAGQFYIRDKLTNFHNPFYGPLAFGTSARSAVLTDWPGGGFIGVHGTNEPELIPGHISHGCIRVANGQILKLARLMKVGSPLTIT